jgi:uncharacterized caspase-like protein
LGNSGYWDGAIAFSPDGGILASGSDDQPVKLWSVKTGQLLKSLDNSKDWGGALAFSPNGKTLASAGGKNGIIKLWEVKTGQLLKSLEGHAIAVFSVAFSINGETLASASADKTIKLWDVQSGRLLNSLEGSNTWIGSLAFSHDGKTLASGGQNGIITLWDLGNGQILKSLEGHVDVVFSVTFSPDDKFLLSGGFDGTMRLWRKDSNEAVSTLKLLGGNDWVVTKPDGRFDTNKLLDLIEGLHWIVNGEILKPLPLDIFMRQYYEPDLWQRILKCNQENNCAKEFKPLPSIADINRVQPKVTIKEIKPATNTADLVEVTIEVESITEDVSITGDRTKKNRFSSGAFDLRLFRDGQLVGVSTPKDKLAQFINAAPRLIAETKESGKLVDTPDDRAWREANDIFKLKSENVKVISPDKVQYTFHNIKLPHDGRQEVEFTAYAFNSDRVKSATTEPFKFTVPTAVVNTPKKGRAFLISIGVNASENPAYDLRYAVNDARKMQEIVGARLKADSDKYSEVIQIPLISDYGADKKLAENTAQKAIIKGVFSLLVGNEKEVPPDVFKRIPNRDKIKPIEPEDTLIIGYSGHGYADESGIFYLLPYDIGANTRKLTPDALQKAISSDELSLWMQDITAAEMIMIIDACHSSAAVQGEGFKPGPMGSRGLGQLAYDKDMKILSATQADNVALESDSIEQGLLSYALLEDGIKNELADVDKDKRLFADELLSFAEKRVPELYQEIKDGKRGVIINGKNIKGDGKRETLDLEDASMNLQNPHLFDFKRRHTKDVLFNLP